MSCIVPVSYSFLHSVCLFGLIFPFHCRGFPQMYGDFWLLIFKNKSLTISHWKEPRFFGVTTNSRSGTGNVQGEPRYLLTPNSKEAKTTRVIVSQGQEPIWRGPLLAKDGIVMRDKCNRLQHPQCLKPWVRNNNKIKLTDHHWQILPSQFIIWKLVNKDRVSNIYPAFSIWLYHWVIK